MAAMDRQPVGRRPQRSAQRAADGQLVSLGRGEAAVYRARMRDGERYLCPACAVPFLTARGGSRADHFVHPPGQPTGGAHAMTVAHAEAQLRLYRWARTLGLQARLGACQPL
jgi:competence CoiA-like predicted nuclease